MQRSTERILTTHVGSLPRPPDLLEMINAKEEGRAFDLSRYRARVKNAVREAVEKQAAAGIDISADKGTPVLATADGLVERVPNKGARVRAVSAEEAVAITECRMVLEALCAAKAAARATDKQIAGLRELGDRLRRCVTDGDPLKYSEANQELHRAVRLISGQAVAVTLLDRLNAQLVRHQFQLALRTGRPGQSLGEHLAIIDAIARHDPDAADKATRQHLTSVIKALREAGQRSRTPTS